MIPSSLNDPQNLFDSRLLTEAVAVFKPDIYWLTESCDIAPCDLNDERFMEKYGNTMKTTMAKLFTNCGDPDQMLHSFYTRWPLVM